MKVRTRIAIIVFVVGAVVALIFVIPRNSEPTFEGQILSYWIGQNEANDSPVNSAEAIASEERCAHARLAVRTIGSNAFPCLVEMAGARDTIFRKLWIRLDEWVRPNVFHSSMADAHREIAACGFAILREQASPVVPRLIPLLRDKDPGVRETAFRCLESIRSGAVAAVPTLIELLGNKDANTRLNALSCLGAIGPEAMPAVPKVLEAMQRTNSSGDFLAGAYTLSRFGPGARLAAPFLFSMMDGSTNAYYRIVAEVTLVKMDEIPLQSYMDRLKDFNDPTNWSQRARFLGRFFTTNVGPAVPLLVAGLKQTNLMIQGASLKAIGAINLRPEICVPAVVEFIRSPKSTNEDVQQQARQTLQIIDPQAAEKAGIK